MNLTLKEWNRFDAYIPNGDCWEAPKEYGTGYGQIYIQGKRWMTHRLSYILFHGDIPEGMLVRHKCDNKLCYNPDHLELGTASDNQKDRAERQPDSYRKANDLMTLKVRVDLQPETMRNLKRQAMEEGVTLDDYIGNLIRAKGA